MGLKTLHTLRPAVPTLQEAEAAGNTSDVDIDQLLLGKLAVGFSLTNVPLPNVPLPNAPLLDVYLDGTVG
jgi:hypothetical protein